MRASLKKAPGFGSPCLALLLAAVVESGCAAGGSVLEPSPPTTALAGQGQWHAAERDGAWTFFYPSGQRLAEGRFEKGRRVGFWRSWYPDQTPFAEGSYDGELDGLWVLYETDGSICIDCYSPDPSEDFVCATEFQGAHHFPWALFSVQQREELRRDVLPFYAGWWSGSGWYVGGFSVEIVERVPAMMAERQSSLVDAPTADD